MVCGKYLNKYFCNHVEERHGEKPPASRITFDDTFLAKEWISFHLLGN